MLVNLSSSYQYSKVCPKRETNKLAGLPTDPSEPGCKGSKSTGSTNILSPRKGAISVVQFLHIIISILEIK